MKHRLLGEASRKLWDLDARSGCLRTVNRFSLIICQLVKIGKTTFASIYVYKKRRKPKTLTTSARIRRLNGWLSSLLLVLLSRTALAGQIEHCWWLRRNSGRSAPNAFRFRRRSRRWYRAWRAAALLLLQTDELAVELVVFLYHKAHLVLQTADLTLQALDRIVFLEELARQCVSICYGCDFEF